MATVDLLSGFHWAEAGASEEAIRQAAELLARALPAAQLEVLRCHNGGEGFVGDDGGYLQLWAVEEIVEYNQTLDAGRLVPGVVLFASNGADDLYGVGTVGGHLEYGVYPAVGLDAKSGERLAGGWTEFLEALAKA